MKKILLTLVALTLFIPSLVFSAPSKSEVLADNTLVTTQGVLDCMAKADTETKLVLTGTATDTFAIIEDGATITTVTLTDTTELWTKTGGMFSFKVDWTAVAGSPAATVYCYKPEQP